ncbi:MAG: hypothetical protein J6B79_06540, partial [Clostridia bacterium]|nr:hypothetical protein [Clostridia bacterium]
QSITVKAVGDGTSFTDSDYSSTQTYTQSTPQPQPSKLATPTVTISSEGVASWQAVTNASRYAYKINGGAESSTTSTSVQLQNGQSITVKAVGDGTSFTDSDYSLAQTFTQSTPQPTTAPTYLGIIASNDQPSKTDIPSGLSAYSLLNNSYATIDETLGAYLSDGNNSMGETAPSQSEYEIFSAIGETVYIQIWLNNPDQNTILSLKLNGTKYQSGGGLQSFFINNDGSYLNCVYVAVQIPNASYDKIEYEVTEIEYVEGTNINQDGKAVLIDEENDTVTIGLPYQQAFPTVEFNNAVTTATTITFDLTLTDTENFVDLIGGWARVIIYDRDNEILAQRKLVSGENAITFDGLSADTYYGVLAFVYGDTHDGEGVSVHALGNQSYNTEGVITVTLESELRLNEQTGKYYPVIKVNGQLGDSSFSFTKVEVSERGENPFTLDFDGSLEITENILNNRDYTVKVYYENANGVEQSYTDYVYIERLDYPWVLEPCVQYGLLDDAVLGFDLGDNKSNFDNLTIRIIDEYSKQYLAENAIYLIDNPNAIAELETQWRSMGRDDPDFNAVYDRWYRLDQTQTKINDYYPDVEKAEWQAELEKGKYTYEYVYGVDEQFFKGDGNKYYIILDGYQSKRINDYSLNYVLSADFDLNDGEPVEEDRTICNGWIDIKPAIGKNDYLFAEQFTLDDENVVYLETKSRNNLGDESYRELGYVNQIVLADGYEILQVLWSQDAPTHDIDEDTWLTAVKNALISGEDVRSVFPLGELEPISFDLDDVDFNTDLVGNFQIRYTYIMYGKTYTDERPYNWDGQVIDYTIKGALPKVTIAFATGEERFGMWSIDSPDWVKNGVWNFTYTIEIRDESLQTVGTYNQDNYGEYERLPLGYSIRVRLESLMGEDYYTQGEWSDWYTCTSIALSTPTNFIQSYETDSVKVEWGYVDRAEKFVYTVNDGTEQETIYCGVTGLKNGDKIKVKAVPASDGCFAESAYSDAYTVTDLRTQLATPTNVRVQNKVLTWNAVENATYYEVEFMQNENLRTERADSTEFYPATIGKTYRVRAMSEDVENYKASEWSEGFTYTVTLENPSFNQVRRERVYWNTVDYAEGYNYKIGETGTVNSTRNYYIAISEIPAGEKLYVQAYAEGCESSDWVMIYHNVTALSIPVVTVTGDTASWNAIENATGYIYKINYGDEQSTTALSVSGLNEGDNIIVCATSTSDSYTNSGWSEVVSRLYTMAAPVFNTDYLSSDGFIEWTEIDGADQYIVEIDGNEQTWLGNKYYDLPLNSTIRVRAVCNSGAYEQLGKWSDYFTYVDSRVAFATPTIAYDVEVGLTVIVEEGVDYYVYKFGQNGAEFTYYAPDGFDGEEITVTQNIIFADGDYTVYLKAVPKDTTNYKESEWATITITFE